MVLDDDDGDDDDDDFVDATDNRAGTTASRPRATPQRTRRTKAAASATPKAADEPPAKRQKALASTRGRQSATAAVHEPPPATAATITTSAVSKAPCPVCGDLVPTGNINSHLDACLSRDTRKASLRHTASSRGSVGSNDGRSDAGTGGDATPVAPAGDGHGASSGNGAPHAAAGAAAGPLAPEAYLRSVEDAAVARPGAGLVACTIIITSLSHSPFPSAGSAPRKRKPMGKMVYKLTNDKNLKKALADVGVRCCARSFAPVLRLHGRLPLDGL